MWAARKECLGIPTPLSVSMNSGFSAIGGLWVLSGGFSYAIICRCGAIARFSRPLLQEVVAFAARGGPVLGLCNGFLAGADPSLALLPGP